MGKSDGVCSAITWLGKLHYKCVNTLVYCNSESVVIALCQYQKRTRRASENVLFLINFPHLLQRQNIWTMKRLSAKAVLLTLTCIILRLVLLHWFPHRTFAYLSSKSVLHSTGIRLEYLSHLKYEAQSIYDLHDVRWKGVDRCLEQFPLKWRHGPWNLTCSN